MPLCAGVFCLACFPYLSDSPGQAVQQVQSLAQVTGMQDASHYVSLTCGTSNREQGIQEHVHMKLAKKVANTIFGRVCPPQSHGVAEDHFSSRQSTIKHRCRQLAAVRRGITFMSKTGWSQALRTPSQSEAVQLQPVGMRVVVRSMHGQFHQCKAL